MGHSSSKGNRRACGRGHRCDKGRGTTCDTFGIDVALDDDVLREIASAGLTGAAAMSGRFVFLALPVATRGGVLTALRAARPNDVLGVGGISDGALTDSAAAELATLYGGDVVLFERPSSCLTCCTICSICARIVSSWAGVNATVAG